MPDLNITEAQLEERDRWERLLVEGRCTLEEALFEVLRSGAPASHLLIERLECAFIAYREGVNDDLAEGFGAPSSQREKRQMAHETHRSNVKFHVEEFHRQGFPLLNPYNHPDRESAYTKTADLLTDKSRGVSISSSTAFDIHRDKDQKRRKGS